MKGNNAATDKGRPAKPARTRAPRPVHAPTTTYDVDLEVGATIQFDPTGERVRIARIHDGQITFEKLP